MSEEEENEAEAEEGQTKEDQTSEGFAVEPEHRDKQGAVRNRESERET